MFWWFLSVIPWERSTEDKISFKMYFRATLCEIRKHRPRISGLLFLPPVMIYYGTAIEWLLDRPVNKLDKAFYSNLTVARGCSTVCDNFYLFIVPRLNFIISRIILSLQNSIPTSKETLSSKAISEFDRFCDGKSLTSRLLSFGNFQNSRNSEKMFSLPSLNSFEWKKWCQKWSIWQKQFYLIN